MVIQFDIIRKKRNEAQQYRQSIELEYDEEDITKSNLSVANVLMQMNQNTELRDRKGERVSPIQWECSCLQKKCGACAMLINGRPRLACEARLKEYKTRVIRLEPLKKFPVIEDLMVDRSILFKNLARITAWLKSSAEFEENGSAIAYEGSRCLQCGCCLEVCPNFYTEGNFYGMSSMVSVSRILEESRQKTGKQDMELQELKELHKLYEKHVYSGCGKSLACRNICPAGIAIEDLLINSNAIAVWKKKFKRRTKGQ